MEGICNERPLDEEKTGEKLARIAVRDINLGAVRGDEEVERTERASSMMGRTRRAAGDRSGGR